jgi:hypothetical protein
MSRSGLLLVSKNFLASDFIMQNELPYLLRAREENRARVFFVVVSDCLWEKSPLRDVQAAHNPHRPLGVLPKSKRERMIRLVCEKMVKDMTIPEALSRIDNLRRKLED